MTVESARTVVSSPIASGPITVVRRANQAVVVRAGASAASEIRPMPRGFDDSA